MNLNTNGHTRMNQHTFFMHTRKGENYHERRKNSHTAFFCQQ